MNKDMPRSDEIVDAGSVQAALDALARDITTRVAGPHKPVWDASSSTAPRKC